MRTEVFRRAAFLLAGATLLAAGAGAQDDEYPTTAGAALRHYEAKVDDWMSGPVDYIVQPDERETWDRLETTEQRIAFIQWFWQRRDPDVREVDNRYKMEFYERVAETNQRFRIFPRGWKSDRGRVYCILGRPMAMSRRSWASIYNAGSGPDFEVWSYNTFTKNLGFTTGGGTFDVYFVEARLGKYEIWDFGFHTAGLWDRNIELAFRYALEETIQDPTAVFETRASAGHFVRAISEGTLPLEVPIDRWAPLGAGGTVSVPIEVSLADLLFEPAGDEFVARLEASLQVRPQSATEAASAAEEWRVRIAQDQLGAVGNGSLVAALSVAAAPGSYDVELKVLHPLAASEAVWGETVEVEAGPAAALVVGRLAVSLDDDEPGAVAILVPVELVFERGGEVVVGVWIRGLEPDTEALSLALESPVSGTHELALESARWLDGPAGPLLLEARLPEVAAGEYRLRVDFGGGLETAGAMIRVAR